MIAITNRLLFFLLNIFISVSSLYGQNQKGNGYIINLENDTIYGALNLASTAVNYSKASITIAGERKKFGPAEIRGMANAMVKHTLLQGIVLSSRSCLEGKPHSIVSIMFFFCRLIIHLSIFLSLNVWLKQDPAVKLTLSMMTLGKRHANICL